MQMKTKSCFSLFLLIALMITGCGGRPVAKFDISGDPNPLYYGGVCATPVMTFTVTGPGAGLEIESIIVAYQLFDGDGKKVKEDSFHLNPVPGATPIDYDADRIIVIADTSGAALAPDEAIVIFGDGHIDFAATIYTKILSPSPSGPDTTYYFTDTKSVPVLPCALPTPLPPTLTPVPVPTKKPKGDTGGGPPGPPSCSVEPNNPNCVNP